MTIQMMHPMQPKYEIIDEVAALQEQRRKAEHHLMLLTGACQLYTQVLVQCQESRCCSVCQRTIEQQQEFEDIIQRMKVGASIYQKRMLNSSYIAARTDCIKCIAELTNDSIENVINADTRSNEWASFEIKKGAIKCLREQKMQSLNVKGCVACGREIDSDFLPQFLMTVDRQANRLERELHIYNAAK